MSAARVIYVVETRPFGSGADIPWRPLVWEESRPAANRSALMFIGHGNHIRIVRKAAA